jgi:hypothetical protein
MRFVKTWINRVASHMIWVGKKASVQKQELRPTASRRVDVQTTDSREELSNYVTKGGDEEGTVGAKANLRAKMRAKERERERERERVRARVRAKRMEEQRKRRATA